MCLAAKHLTLVVFCTFLPAAILCPSRPARPPPARGRRHLPRRGRGAPRDGGAGPPPAPYPRPRAAAIAPSLRSRRCHGDPRRRGGRPGAVSLSAGVAIRQRRDGLQLQREEEVRDLAPPLALPRPGWKGNGGTGPLRGGRGDGAAACGGRPVVAEPLRRPVPLPWGGAPAGESRVPRAAARRPGAWRGKRRWGPAAPSPSCPASGEETERRPGSAPGRAGESRSRQPSAGGGGGMQARFYTTLCAQSSGYLASLSKSPLLVSRPPPLRNQFCKSFAKQRGGRGGGLPAEQTPVSFWSAWLFTFREVWLMRPALVQSDRSQPVPAGPPHASAASCF